MPKVARRVLALVPAKQKVLRIGALLPPKVRSELSFRFFTALASYCLSLPDEFTTNLGIDKRLRVRIPSDHLVEVFGTPRLNVPERATVDLALALSRHSDCFVDVGSHIGLFVFHISCSGSNRTIYYFEPDPGLFGLLQTNLVKNKINAVGFQAAVTESSGRVVFYQNKSSSLSGTIVKDAWSGNILRPMDVAAISFEDFAAERNLKNACVKVDVEGAEEQFWQGAKKALGAVDSIIIEMLGPAIKERLPARIIRESGFHAYYVNDYSLRHSVNGEFTYVHPFYNWLFCRESPSALRKKLIGTSFHVTESASSR